MSKNDKKGLALAKKLIKKCLETKNTFLDLGNCGLTDLNELPELFSCTHIESLNFSNYWFDLDKDKFIYTSNGDEIESNKLDHIPKKIQECKRLQKLIVRGNEIGDISFVSILKNLTHLNLSSNKISDISFLSDLKDLTHLNLNSNQISDISFLSDLYNLTSLHLGSNQISDISFLSELEQLKTLDVSSNEISDVSILSRLFRLVSLKLSSNKIRNIRFLSGLTHLKNLYLSFNQISDISFLSKLTKLEELDLRGNLIIRIPEPILKLNIEIYFEEYNKDKGCFIFKNPIEEPPIEIIKQGKQSMLDWYAANKKKLDEIKIILIGDPKSGKTSLLRRLKDNTFSENEVQTDGINIEDIDFGESETFKKQEKLHTITGHFWDFGGQEIMSATHSLFLTNRSVYILVLDARNDKNVSVIIRKEVKRIRATGGDSPIIIVANQIDVNNGFGFENEYELQQEFPQIKYFIKASCKDKTNIEFIKEKLEEQILESELLNTVIDERWIAIKEQFQKELLTELYLGEDRFIEICQECKLNQEFGQQNALQFLHDLGLVLHFKEVKGYDYYVLNPYWITYGVYQILTSKKVGELLGKIPYSELEYIINIEEDKERVYRHKDFERILYTPGQREFLIQILHQFKLCFILRDQETFIIPDLLTTEEPFNITEAIRKDEQSIHFVYTYDFLPRVVMPFILVETYQYHHTIWRTGCVLDYEGCMALISQYDDKISILLTGEYRKKQEFSAIIRRYIDEINRNIHSKTSLLIPLFDTGEYVDYEELIEIEEEGENVYKIYKPFKASFNISELLEGYKSFRLSSSDDESEKNKLDKKRDKLVSRFSSFIQEKENIKNQKKSLGKGFDNDQIKSLNKQEENIDIAIKNISSEISSVEDENEKLEKKEDTRKRIKKAIRELKRPILGKGSINYQLWCIIIYLILAFTCFTILLITRFSAEIDNIETNELILIISQYIFLISFFWIFLSQANKAYQLYRKLINRRHQLESLEGALYSKLEISSEINEMEEEINNIVNNYINKVVFIDKIKEEKEIQTDVDIFKSINKILGEVTALKSKIEKNKD